MFGRFHNPERAPATIEPPRFQDLGGFAFLAEALGSGYYRVSRWPDLTREILRNELFGHERGAFTPAVSRRAELLSRVDGGTLFMDEIGELAPDAQAMLLGFLQEGEGRPAVRRVSVDVGIVAATHRDLEDGVERGTFREDFHYRLWWAVLEVPPLRARRGDIELLVEHFRGEVNRRSDLGLDITGISRDAMAILEGDHWPGNVRELEAVVKRAMVRGAEDG